MSTHTVIRRALTALRSSLESYGYAVESKCGDLAWVDRHGRRHLATVLDYWEDPLVLRFKVDCSDHPPNSVEWYRQLRKSINTEASAEQNCLASEADVMAEWLAKRLDAHDLLEVPDVDAKVWFCPEWNEPGWRYTWSLAMREPYETAWDKANSLYRARIGRVASPTSKA